MRTFSKFAFALLILTFAAPLTGGCGDDGPDLLPPLPIYDAAPPSPPDAGACDPVAQDCTDGKCSLDLTQVMNTSTWGATCRAQTGTTALGEHCTRMAEGAPGVGKDSCASGGYCTAIGDLGGVTDASARTCRSFCLASTSCTKGQTCFALTTDLKPRDVGICVNTCDIRETGTCTAGAWCSFVVNIEQGSAGQCQPIGPAAIGANCDATTNCVENAICITTTPQGGGDPTNACREVCDVVAGDAGPKHACPANFTCRALSSGPTDWGICSPNM
jgi:hypothetical protein